MNPIALARNAAHWHLQTPSRCCSDSNSSSSILHFSAIRSRSSAFTCNSCRRPLPRGNGTGTLLVSSGAQTATTAQMNVLIAVTIPVLCMRAFHILCLRSKHHKCHSTPPHTPGFTSRSLHFFCITWFGESREFQPLCSCSHRHCPARSESIAFHRHSNSSGTIPPDSRHFRLTHTQAPAPPHPQGQPQRIHPYFIARR